MINALSDISIIGPALYWISSFLTERTFCVRIGSCYSSAADVTSGVIQGSTLGPILYDVFIDSLLRVIKLPLQAFADDLKFVADVAVHSKAAVQSDVDTLCAWADYHGTPLSVEKCSVLHCGPHQPSNDYYIRSTALKSVNNIVDLGVKQTIDGKFSEHCQEIISKATRVCGMIRRVFHSGHQKLLWPTFTYYVLPTLTYCSPVWCPSLQRDITAVENVQRRFSKKIRGLGNLSYAERLHELGALSLSARRMFTDMVTTYKYIHGLTKCPLADIGLNLRTSITRGGGLRLFQRRPNNRSCSSLFCYRAASNWNKLPLYIINSSSIHSFKLNLYKHLFALNNI